MEEAVNIFERVAEAAEIFPNSSTAMPAMKPATSSNHTCTEGENDLGFPEISQESVRLMEDRPLPSFAEQISHARMLLSWKKGRPADHPPRQTERFEM